jgi:hypothetical protein
MDLQMTTTPANIPHNEFQDFLRGVAELGFDPGEFMLSAATTTQAQALGHVMPNISVERTPPLGSPVTLEYDSGNGPAWVHEALGDLRSTRFGNA